MADIEKVKSLLAKLNAGKDVSLRDLKNTLGDEGVKEFEGLWQEELERRKEFENKPDAIKKYEEMVHAADFSDSRADGIKVIGKRSKFDMQGRSSKQRLRDSAETQYERAIEYLEEIIAIDENLRIWFDRDISFENGTKISIDAVGIPRTVTSRSVHKLGSGNAAKQSKEDIKRQLLEATIRKFEYEQNLTVVDRQEIEQQQNAILKDKLAKLKNSGY